jgi:hypothetical protein
LLVADALFLLLLALKLESVDVFAKCENHVGLLLDVSLSAENFCFTTTDLFANSSDLNLGLVR